MDEALDQRGHRGVGADAGHGQHDRPRGVPGRSAGGRSSRRRSRRSRACRGATRRSASTASRASGSPPRAPTPENAMRSFVDWVEAVAAGRRPVFVGFNATFDWMFVADYAWRFVGRNPFGAVGLDLKALYLGRISGEVRRWSETTSDRDPAALSDRDCRTRTRRSTTPCEQAEMCRADPRTGLAESRPGRERHPSAPGVVQQLAPGPGAGTGRRPRGR